MIIKILIFCAVFSILVMAGYITEKYFRFDHPAAYYLKNVFYCVLVYVTIPVNYFLFDDFPVVFQIAYLITTIGLASNIGIAIFKFRHIQKYMPESDQAQSSDDSTKNVDLGLKA